MKKNLNPVKAVMKKTGLNKGQMAARFASSGPREAAMCSGWVPNMKAKKKGC